MLKEARPFLALAAFAAVAVMQAKLLMPDNWVVMSTTVIACSLPVLAGHALQRLVRQSAELGDYAYGGKSFNRRMEVMTFAYLGGLALTAIAAQIWSPHCVPSAFLWAIVVITVGDCIGDCARTKRRHDAI